MRHVIISRYRKIRSGLERLRAAGLRPEKPIPETKPAHNDESARAGTTGPPPPPPSADETSEGREQRVAELREQVKTDTYEIPVAHLVRILASRLFGKG